MSVTPEQLTELTVGDVIETDSMFPTMFPKASLRLVCVANDSETGYRTFSGSFFGVHVGTFEARVEEGTRGPMVVWVFADV